MFLPMVTFWLPDFLLDFFGGAVPIASSQFLAVGGKMPGDEGPPTSGVCGGQIRGRGPV